MRLAKPIIAIVAMTALVLTAGAGPVEAGTTVTSAVAYIHPDLLQDGPNADIDEGSSCASPDRDDPSAWFTPEGPTDLVVIRACLFDSANNPVDATVSFETSAGDPWVVICFDPDGPGPIAVVDSDPNDCTVTGYNPETLEYQAGPFASGPGLQTITFCFDPKANGCGDATISDQVTVNWEWHPDPYPDRPSQEPRPQSTPTPESNQATPPSESNVLPDTATDAGAPPLGLLVIVFVASVLTAVGQLHARRKMAKPS